MFVDPTCDLSAPSASVSLLDAGRRHDRVARNHASFVIAIGGVVLAVLIVLVVGFTAFATLI